MTRSRAFGTTISLALIVAQVVYLSTANGAVDPATLLAATRAQINFQGPARLSSAIGISQEIQIQSLSEDYGSGQPIGWAMNISSGSQVFQAEIAWSWTKSAGAAFAYSLDQGQQTSANTGSATCFDGKGYCTTNPNNWNLNDPFRLNFGPDMKLGAGWWIATITDLATGELLDLGSVKRSTTNNFSNLKITEQIYRPTLADDCPSDAAPTADTYFGPIVDSSGGEDVSPVGTLETHKCANAKLGTLINSAGAYVLYGGSEASIEASPRSDSFSPSNLIASAAFPIPDAPTQFSYVTAGGLLSLAVQVPHLNTQGVKAVFLVSPELGHPETNPVYAVLVGSSAHLQLPITPALLGQTFNLILYSQTGFVISDPLQETVTIPKNALTVSAISHKVPKGISAVPAIATKVPAAPKGLRVSVEGDLLTMTATSTQKSASAANGAYLIAPLLNHGSFKPISLTIIGSNISLNLQLDPSLRSQVLKFSLYLTNRVGKSNVASGSYKIP